MKARLVTLGLVRSVRFIPKKPCASDASPRINVAPGSAVWAQGRAAQVLTPTPPFTMPPLGTTVRIKFW